MNSQPSGQVHDGDYLPSLHKQGGDEFPDLWTTQSITITLFLALIVVLNVAEMTLDVT